MKLRYLLAIPVTLGFWLVVGKQRPALSMGMCAIVLIYMFGLWPRLSTAQVWRANVWAAFGVGVALWLPNLNPDDIIGGIGTTSFIAFFAYPILTALAFITRWWAGSRQTLQPEPHVQEPVTPVQEVVYAEPYTGPQAEVIPFKPKD